MGMITQRFVQEWLVEPEIEGAREYARLSITAELDGLNIDGQGIIPWTQIIKAIAAARKNNQYAYR